MRSGLSTKLCTSAHDWGQVLMFQGQSCSLFRSFTSDFGIAAVAHSSRSLSIEQGIGGTLPYMAPEQIAGKPRTASDQYALGIVVYEWIAGRRPFTGTAAEIILQHNTTPPPSLQEQLPTLPIDVEQVVMRALAKDPRSRFADIDEFASTLEVASKRAEPPKQPPERSLSVRSPLPLHGPVSMRHQTDQLNTVDPSVTEDLLIPMHSITPSEVEGMPPVTQPVDEPIPVPVAMPPTPAFTIHEQTPLHSSAPAPGPALPAQPPDTPLPAGAYQAPVQPAQIAWPPRMPVNTGSKTVQTAQFARPAQVPASIPPARVWATGFLLIFVPVLVVTTVGTWLAFATIGVVGGDTRLDSGVECILAFMFVIISFGATMFVHGRLAITFLAASALLMAIVALALLANFFAPGSTVTFINVGLFWASFFSLLWVLRPYQSIDRLMLMTFFGAAAICSLLALFIPNGTAYVVFCIIALILGTLIAARTEQVRLARG